MVSMPPIVQDRVSAATRGGPVGNGGVTSTDVGGGGGVVVPARYGVLKENVAPTQLPPNGAVGWASCQVPRLSRNAVTAITCPPALAAVAALPGATAAGSPPGGIAFGIAYPYCASYPS